MQVVVIKCTKYIKYKIYNIQNIQNISKIHNSYFVYFVYFIYFVYFVFIHVHVMRYWVTLGSLSGPAGRDLRGGIWKHIKLGHYFDTPCTWRGCGGTEDSCGCRALRVNCGKPRLPDGLDFSLIDCKYVSYLSMFLSADPFASRRVRISLYSMYHQ